MPEGKAAGTRCIQLDENERCLIFGHPERPSVCASLQPERTMCGETREYALHWLRSLEDLTAPSTQRVRAGPADASRYKK